MAERSNVVSRLSVILLWLFVLDLGIALGAGLFESRIVVPDWVDAGAGEWHPDVVRHDDTGRRFWVAVTTIPLTLLTLANLVAAWRAPADVRRSWLTAAGIAVVERAMTLGYFVPTMVRLMRSENSAEVVAAAVRWTQLNQVRHLLVFAALLAALRTFALVYARRRSA